MGETDTERYERYVIAGIDRLSNYFGSKDWVDRINVDRLSMQSTQHCVLAQLFGNFSDGMDRLGISRTQADTEGFSLGGTEQYAVDYALLNTVWKHRIKDIKEKRATETTAEADAGINEITELLQIAARLKKIGAVDAVDAVLAYVHDAIDRL